MMLMWCKLPRILLIGGMLWHRNRAHSSLISHGSGLSSVRFICGTQDIHKQLEKQIADFHGKEDAILYASCFDANAGIFEATLTAKDAVIRY